MTQHVERAHVGLTEPPAVADPRQTPAAPTGPRPWWSQWYLWLVVLLGEVIFNLIYALPRYLSGDPDQSRSALNPAVSQHWALLVAHVVTGNVAMVTVLLQLWPWLRRNHPKVHRVSGRVYILAGALPSAGLGLFALLPIRHGGPGSIGLGFMAVLWIVTSLLGWWTARQGRYVEHRRWMVYSFALALGTTYGRFVVVALTMYPGLAPHINFDILIEVTSWLGWVVNLMVAHLWLESRGTRTSKAGGEIVTYPSVL